MLWPQIAKLLQSCQVGFSTVGVVESAWVVAAVMAVVVGLIIMVAAVVGGGLTVAAALVVERGTR